MKLRKIVSVSILAVAVGCAPSKKSPTAPAIATGPTPVVNAAQGAGATAATTQAAALAVNAAASLGAIASASPRIRAAPFQAAADPSSRLAPMRDAQQRALALPRARLAAALRAPATVTNQLDPCSGGGTVTSTGTVDDATGAFTLTLEFANCREGDVQVNGKASASGTSTATAENFTMKLGDGNGSVGDSNVLDVMMFSGSNLFATYKIDVSMSGTTSCTDGASCASRTITFAATGKEIFNDFFSQSNIDYRNLALTGTETATTSSMTLTGGAAETWATGVGTSAVHHTTTFTYQTFTDQITTGATYRDEEIDGTVLTLVTPVSDSCFAGRFELATEVPIRTDSAANRTTAGRLVVNGNVTVDFRADGAVDVTVAGQAPARYPSAADLENVCQIQDMGPADASPTLVTTGANTTGNNLLATLTWTGTGCPTSGCTSDMDTHLEHFASQSPHGTAADWHVYFGNKTDGGVAALDYDDVEGYGPEHITMTTLPDGYYMLYIDPFSMDSDTSATIYVSLQIGRSAFSFPTHTFFSAGEPVHRIIDFVVTSGNVTLRQPDQTLTTDFAAPSLRAQKLR